MVRRLVIILLSLLTGFGPVSSQGPLPSPTPQPNRLYEGDTLIPRANGQPERRLKVLQITSSSGSEALVTLQDLDSGAKYTLSSSVVGNMAKTAKIVRGSLTPPNPGVSTPPPKLDKLPLPAVPALPPINPVSPTAGAATALDPLAPLPSLAPQRRKPEPLPLKPQVVSPPPTPEFPQGEPRRLPMGLQPIELPGVDAKRTAIERSRVLPQPDEPMSASRPAPDGVARVAFENLVPLPPASASSPATAPTQASASRPAESTSSKHKALPPQYPAPAPAPQLVQSPKMDAPALKAPSIPMPPPVSTLPEVSNSTVEERPKPIPIKTTPAPAAPVAPPVTVARVAPEAAAPSTTATPAQPAQSVAAVSLPNSPAEIKPLRVERNNLAVVEVLKPYSPDEDDFAERVKFAARYPEQLRPKQVAPPLTAEAPSEKKTLTQSGSEQHTVRAEQLTPAPQATPKNPVEEVPAVVLPPRTRLKLPSQEADEIARRPLIVDHSSKLVPPTWPSSPSSSAKPTAFEPTLVSKSVVAQLPETVAAPRIKLPNAEPIVSTKITAPTSQPMKVDQPRDDAQKLRDPMARQIGRPRYEGLPPGPASLTAIRNGPALNPGERLGIETAEAVKELFTALRPTLRERAASSLAECRYNWRPEVKGVLAQAAVRDPAASVRAHCINLLNQLGYSEPEYLRMLEELAATDEPIVRRAAESALAKFLPKR